MAWNLESDRPIYLQLIEQIGRLIVSGFYQPGDKLPSVRDLAADASVNPNTMQKALAELERSGLIYTNRTSGRFITEDNDMIVQTRHTLAQEQLLAFLRKMNQLGFSKEETIDFILKTASELNIPEQPNKPAECI